ncbi:extracellular solute-binding protein [Rhizobium sp. L1K21]|uniref:extracellular solute-binding protein n=1 Tax=Rhizobium sp. L1K21 TaxID=2954933 RepID=UPI0020937974|nr:extracellular solute-binding protein [Rhizobium sp. L1K21]MCO6186051.1 extracellular solute-binding protein [Rhizobium sp. L1K21]
MKKLIVSLFALFALCQISVAEPLHGIAMHGAPALPADYTHFPYANPDAPKGGRITYGVVGNFDSLNPFVLKSMRTTARGMWDPGFGNLYFEALMQRSRDEPFTMYGLLAKSVEWDPERTYIQFNIDPQAKWADGKPVTADDVIFTFELLRDHGRAPYSTRLARVKTMEKVGENSVRFTFNDTADREFPLILALSPVLPKHAIDPDTFENSGLTPIVGSGPYAIKEIKPGEKIVYERRKDYWGKDIPAKVGFDNYDEIQVNYYLQETALFEAFKKGEVDVYLEGNPGKWAEAYNFPAATSGDVVKETFNPQVPSGMLGFVFNTRRKPFDNEKLREALSLAYDFEWANKNLYNNAYTRTQSFWQNSDLSSFGVPASDAERKLLGDAAKTMDPEYLDGTYKQPVTDGSGRDRKILRQVVDTLKEAGYTIQGNKMVGPDGKQLAFEIMTQNADQERFSIPFQRTLAAIGIDVKIRTVDDSSYQKRTQEYDYDVIVKAYTSSLSPGAEQAWRWGSAGRDRPGTDNFAGVADPAVDRLIETIVNAREEDEFQTAVRAFDRLLMSRHYVVPLYHIGEQWVAHWAYIHHPEKLPLYGYQLPVWWDSRAE